MSLESSDDIESSGLGWSAEAPSEKSEKQREAAKKAHSQLQKTQKDEKKARWDSDALFTILIHFIKNPYYEDLVPFVTWLLEQWFPSRYILGLVWLVYPDAALHLFGSIGNHDRAMKITQLHRYEEMQPFDEHHIDTSLRDWVSLWVNAFEKYMTFADISVITSQKLAGLLQNPVTREYATLSSERFFRFFFVSRNVDIAQSQALQYARFIITILIDALTKHLSLADEDLKKQDTIDEKDLFGI